MGGYYIYSLTTTLVHNRFFASWISRSFRNPPGLLHHQTHPAPPSHIHPKQVRPFPLFSFSFNCFLPPDPHRHFYILSSTPCPSSTQTLSSAPILLFTPHFLSIKIKKKYFHPPHHLRTPSYCHHKPSSSSLLSCIFSIFLYSPTILFYLNPPPPS